MRFLLLAALLGSAALTSDLRAQYKYQTYQAKPSATSATATAKVKIISPNDPGWKTELLRVLNAEKNRLAAAQKQAEENATYLQALGALGAPVYGQGTAAQSSAYGGDSLYGYTYSTVADYYNQADRTVLANQAYNTASRSLDLAGKWSDNMRDLYSLEIGAQERTASIIAEGQKASEIIRAAAHLAEASKQQHTRITTQGQVIGKQPPTAPDKLPVASHGPGDVLKQKCASCHAGVAAPKGIVLDGSQPVSFKAALASMRAIDEGTMPPPEKNIQISDVEYDAIEADLASLIGR